ncbi:hypothetical protein GIB67_030052, partial [Kingdonia uniflora]
ASVIPKITDPIFPNTIIPIFPKITDPIFPNPKYQNNLFRKLLRKFEIYSDFSEYPKFIPKIPNFVPNSGNSEIPEIPKNFGFGFILAVPKKIGSDRNRFSSSEKNWKNSEHLYFRSENRPT